MSLVVFRLVTANNWTGLHTLIRDEQSKNWRSLKIYKNTNVLLICIFFFKQRLIAIVFCVLDLVRKTWFASSSINWNAGEWFFEIH